MQTRYPILLVSDPEIKKEGTCTHSFYFISYLPFFLISSYFINIIFSLTQALSYWEKRNEKTP